MKKQQSYLEGTHERVIHRHHATCIVKLSTVIGCRKQRDQLALGEKLITIFNNLQTETKSQIQNSILVMSVEELADHVCSKCEGHAPIILPPAHDILVGI
ncbi:hypothetical protein EGW08_019000 [Elysia chlorotica]|uniref:Uncharacterized protein n=1 Tax=Elysia chlorotica TaxID=188477 RepID=A0A3S0ZQZ7_ELYCH|nr:hypothetical protein EGW08_019000 [Elysia chlorotica]